MLLPTLPSRSTSDALRTLSHPPLDRLLVLLTAAARLPHALPTMRTPDLKALVCVAGAGALTSGSRHCCFGIASQEWNMETCWSRSLQPAPSAASSGREYWARQLQRNASLVCLGG
jgi:hypothetical protein